MTAWERLRTPPKTALKEIQAGRLKGKYDINPTWRLQAMTEVFGMCGVGWYYTIDRDWQAEKDGQVAVFVQVSVYVKTEIGWSMPIPGTGGSMLVAKEKNGLYMSDEAYKMATTDALSVALKALGVGADIYLGMADSKYQNILQDEIREWKAKINERLKKFDDQAKEFWLSELKEVAALEEKDKLECYKKIFVDMEPVDIEVKHE